MQMQRRQRGASARGMSYVEVLMATIVLAIVAAGAVASWSLSSQVAATKRAVEIGNTIAVEEIERLKAIRYPYLAVSPVVGGQPVPTVRWYDKYGNWLGPSAATGDFKAKVVIRVLIDRDGKANNEDLKEAVVEVWDTNETRRYEIQRTLLTYGGV